MNGHGGWLWYEVIKVAVRLEVLNLNGNMNFL